MTNRRTRTDRPAKPYADFPLFPHATGRWAKKVRGRFVFFGPWADPQGAVKRYLEQRDHLYAGIAPPSGLRRRGRASAGSGGADGAAPGAVGPTSPHVGPAPGGGEPGRGNPTAPRRGRVGQTSGAGQSGAGAAEGLELRDLVNHFLTAKQRRLDAGDMGLRSFSDYHATAGRVVEFLGKHRELDGLTQDDFARLWSHLALARGPVALGNEIGRVRSIFKHGYEAGLLDRPMRYGPEFRKPSKRTVRLARRAKGERMFEAEEIHAMLNVAGIQIRAMIYLAANAGMGNSDVAMLTRSVVNLKTGIVEFPRPKTGVARRAVLWPETIAALRALAKVRPKPTLPEHSDLVFVTRFGQPWVRVSAPGKRSQGKHRAVVKDSVAMEFCKVARAAGVGKDGRGFYALRHTFRTIADEVGDRPAVDLVMGHENGADIATHYVERISDERLRAVTEHVRDWLLAAADSND